METILMTPAVVERYKDFLVNPKKWGCTYKPLHEVFVEGDHYTPQDELFDEYIKYLNKPLPEFMFFIVMGEEFPEYGGCDEWDTVNEKGETVHHRGNFGYKLKLNLD